MHGGALPCTSPIATIILKNREFPSYNSVSAAVHALEQTTNFAFTSNGLCREFHEHFSPSSAAEVCSSHVQDVEHRGLCLILLRRWVSRQTPMLTSILKHSIGGVAAKRLSRPPAVPGGTSRDAWRRVHLGHVVPKLERSQSSRLRPRCGRRPRSRLIGLDNEETRSPNSTPGRRGRRP